MGIPLAALSAAPVPRDHHLNRAHNTEYLRDGGIGGMSSLKFLLKRRTVFVDLEPSIYFGVIYEDLSKV
jgi:hypothetical protein